MKEKKMARKKYKLGYLDRQQKGQLRSNLENQLGKKGCKILERLRTGCKTGSFIYFIKENR